MQERSTSRFRIVEIDGLFHVFIRMVGHVTRSAGLLSDGLVVEHYGKEKVFRKREKAERYLNRELEYVRAKHDADVLKMIGVPEEESDDR